MASLLAGQRLGLDSGAKRSLSDHAKRLHVRCTAEVATAPRTAQVQFRLPIKVNYGQNIAVVGADEQLGAWSIDQAAQAVWTEGDIWVTDELPLPARSEVEYKFVIRNKDGTVVEWQPGDNLVVKTLPDAAQVVVINEWVGGAPRVLVVGAEDVFAQPAAMNGNGASAPATSSEAAEEGTSAGEALSEASSFAASNGSNPCVSAPPSAFATAQSNGMTKPVDELTVKELKVTLKGLGLGGTGRKAELISRLKAALAA